jgi:hypothetical protein
MTELTCKVFSGAGGALDDSQQQHFQYSGPGAAGPYPPQVNDTALASLVPERKWGTITFVLRPSVRRL